LKEKRGGLGSNILGGKGKKSQGEIPLTPWEGGNEECVMEVRKRRDERVRGGVG